MSDPVRARAQYWRAALGLLVAALMLPVFATPTAKAAYAGMLYGTSVAGISP